MMTLSLFPGIGILDQGFEEQGFCVVRGPDLLWGGDIQRFHVPPDVFDGVIGGTPCQAFSRFVPIIKKNGYDLAPNLIPEFERVVKEARPRWFLMENVETAPLPSISGYVVHAQLLDNRWLGEEQRRRHLFSFGTKTGIKLRFRTTVFENAEWAPRVMAAGGATVKLRENGIPKRIRRTGKARAGDYKAQSTSYFREAAKLQGLPDGWDIPPFTVAAKIRALGNAVPLTMARELGRAVKEALVQIAEAS